MAELPPKLFFRIGEVAGLVGVEPHVLRYWEREFRSIRPTKSAKGQRVYSRKDVENLLRVRDLLYRDGFTIAGAKKKLQRPVATGMGQVESDEETASITEGLDDFETDNDAAPVTTDEASGAGESIAGPAFERLGSHGSREQVTEKRGHVESSRGGAPRAQENVREKLLALRVEIEDFLVELSATAPRSAPVSGTAARGSAGAPPRAQRDERR